MKLEQFYSLLSRNAKVTLTARKQTHPFYRGSLKDIPDEYSYSTVEDFTMSNGGEVTFIIKAPKKTTDAEKRFWSEGTIKIPDANDKTKTTWCHYWVKHYDEPSEFGINGGRISKLMIKVNDKVTLNYDRGWDVRPQDPETKMAYIILLQNYN